MTSLPARDREASPSGFFALRTPLLPFDELAAWSAGLRAPSAGGDRRELEHALAEDRAELRGGLRGVLARPEVREAVFLASPSLDEALSAWLEDPDSERGRNVEPALVAYFSRAAARATPFGLFAGCTTGLVGPRTRLRLGPRSAYQRHSRLDMDYLWALAGTLERDADMRRAFRYEPNSSLHEVAGRLHFAATALAGTRRSYHLVAVDRSPYLSAVLDRARGGASLSELAAVLVDDEITVATAEAFVAELVDRQILVAQARPVVTGEEPVHPLAATLAAYPSTAKVGAVLHEASGALRAIDAEGPGAAPDRYREVADLVDDLPARPDLSRLVQVDLVKPPADVTLGPRLVTELQRGVHILHRLAPPRSGDALARFQEQFSERYETREVPLLEVLDEETGIGFEKSRSPLAEAAPLLAGLPFPVQYEDATSWSRRDGFLLRKLADAMGSGRDEIEITDKDLDALAGRDDERRRPLPDAFYVMGSVAADSDDAVDRGAFQVLVGVVGGPSGATLLGRFCHADGSLLAHVRAHLREEEARRPGAVFAEVVHLPEGRIGNILCRPLLRDYEIPFLGRSGAPEERRIAVDDLLVSVGDGRIVLRSRRLGREVLPRLTTAHNYSWRSLGVYRFLCALQHHDVESGLAWDWGPLEAAPYLPRVVSGRVVLCRARWRLDEGDVTALTRARGSQQYAVVQGWRAARRLPRHVALVDDDNELVLDLDNVLSVEALAHQLRGRGTGELVELFPGPGALCATSEEGRFVHEIVVPFVAAAPAEPGDAEVRMAPGDRARPAVRRRFPPGSEWLYGKLYAGPAAVDQVLVELARAVVEPSIASGAARRWFFLRYDDPEHHLRVRFAGAPSRLQAEVLPALQAVAGTLERRGLVWRVQLDTYEREVERYGGDEAIELAEAIFCADSDAAVTIVRSLSGDVGLDLRWRLAVLGIDLLFDDLGLSLDEKRTVAREARLAYGREFRTDGAFRTKLSERYRKERAELEALLDGGEANPSLAAGIDALRRRSVALAPAAGELRGLAGEGRLSTNVADVARSCAHMHVNRLLRSAQRAQELVLYELLDRLYTSQAARRPAAP